MSKYYIRPYKEEQTSNSYSVFKRGVMSMFGGPYCLEAGITYEQAQHPDRADMLRAMRVEIRKAMGIK